MDFNKIINYLNENTILVLATVGAAFTLLTCLMLVLSMISNGSTKRQLKALTRTLRNEQNPRVVPRFNTHDGKVKCLTFENIGNGYAKNINVELNQEWLEAKYRLPDYASNNITLANLKTMNLFLSSKESISYGLYNAVTESYEADTLKNQQLVATITYEDTMGNPYKETFVLELITHESSLETDANDDKAIRDIGEKIDALRPAVAKIEPAVAKIENALTNLNRSLTLIEPALRANVTSFNNIDSHIAEMIDLNKKQSTTTKKR